LLLTACRILPLKKQTEIEPIWALTEGDSPIVATAIHDGHAVRPELEPFLALSDGERLREEDPFTAGWTKVVDTRIVGLRSRFEVDLNRPSDKSIYLKPEDAWGLTVFNKPLPEEIVARTVAEYDAFYLAMHTFFTGLAERHGRFVVLDIHTYNHRREGPDEKPADSEGNPEVNLGTATMPDRGRFASAVDGFIDDLRAFDFDGGSLDVRENVKFKGGNFAAWIHENFPENACVLSVEFKKFFMNEWTGLPDENQVGMIHAGLESTLTGLREFLKN